MHGWMDCRHETLLIQAIQQPLTTPLGHSAGLGYSSSTGFGLRVLFSCRIICCMLPLRRFWLKWHDTHTHTHTHACGLVIWIVYKPLQLPIWLQFYLKCQKAHFGFFSSRPAPPAHHIFCTLSNARFSERIYAHHTVTAPDPSVRLPAICLAA